MADLQHVLAPGDLSDADRRTIMARAMELKRTDPTPVLSKLRVGGLYFNPSLRTRVSFEQAVRMLGGTCQTLNITSDTWAIEMDPNAVMDGTKVENVVEAARVLGQFFHILGVRSFPSGLPWDVERTEPVLRTIAKYAGVPVISLEGSTHHPCQGLADVMTLHETFGPELSGLPVALTWAYHPKALPMAVPNTFLAQAALAGCDVSVIHPDGFDLDSEIVATARREARSRGGDVHVTHDRVAGLKGRRVVYVKSWGRVGGGPTTDPSLVGWQTTESSLTGTDHGRVMHCLPVRRNVVIAGDVLDGPRSLVVQQAGNRMWAQAALVEYLARRQGVIA